MAAQKKYRGTANPELYRAMLGKRTSSAASPHDPRPNRQRTRADQRKTAIRNNGW